MIKIASNDIVLASGNQGKIKEFSAILEQYTIIPQSHFQVSEAEETGGTFVENAIIKARHVALQCNLPVIADDSGLMVDALAGAPGIFSARYASLGASDNDNLNKVLEAMHGVSETQRSARFVCVIVYMRSASDACPIITQGVWEGQLLTESVGENGFGYDSIFAVPGYNCSSAELSPITKNAISHRGLALLEFKNSMNLLLRN